MYNLKFTTAFKQINPSWTIMLQDSLHLSTMCPKGDIFLEEKHNRKQNQSSICCRRLVFHIFRLRPFVFFLTKNENHAKMNLPNKLYTIRDRCFYLLDDYALFAYLKYWIKCNSNYMGMHDSIVLYVETSFLYKFVWRQSELCFSVR